MNAPFRSLEIATNFETTQPTDIYVYVRIYQIFRRGFHKGDRTTPWWIVSRMQKKHFQAWIFIGKKLTGELLWPWIGWQYYRSFYNCSCCCCCILYKLEQLKISWCGCKYISFCFCCIFWWGVTFMFLSLSLAGIHLDLPDASHTIWQISWSSQRRFFDTKCAKAGTLGRWERACVSSETCWLVCTCVSPGPSPGPWFGTLLGG